MSNWCFVQDNIPNEFIRKSECRGNEDLCFDDKYTILFNGKRYKKDSREWLHKTSKSRKYRLKTENNYTTQETNYKYHTGRNCCTLKDILTVSDNKRNSENRYVSRDHVTRSVHSCKSYINIDETAKSPELFVNYRKRRLASPSYNMKSPLHTVVSERDLNLNLSDRWTVCDRHCSCVDNRTDIISDRYFVPIPENRENVRERCTENPGYETAGDTLDITWAEGFRREISVPGTDWSATQDSTNHWRSTKSIPSDDSSTSTPTDEIVEPSSNSANQMESPFKRCKTENEEINSNGDNLCRRDLDRSHHSVSTVEDKTACGSPWMSLESIPNKFTISENENKP